MAPKKAIGARRVASRSPRPKTAAVAQSEEVSTWLNLSPSGLLETSLLAATEIVVGPCSPPQSPPTGTVAVGGRLPALPRAPPPTPPQLTSSGASEASTAPSATSSASTVPLDSEQQEASPEMAIWRQGLYIFVVFYLPRIIKLIPLLLIAFVIIFALGAAWTCSPIRAVSSTTEQGLATMSAAFAATTKVLTAAANLTEKVTIVTLDAVEGGKGLIHDVTTGVDLTNVSITSEGGVVVAPSAWVLEAWLRNDSATGIPWSLRSKWLESVLTAEHHGLLQHTSTFTKVHGDVGLLYYARAEVTIPRFASSEAVVQFEFELFQCSFQVAWANPLWYVWGFEPSAQELQIQERLQSVIFAYKGTQGALEHRR